MGNHHSCNCLNKYSKIITLYNNQICKRIVIINEITGESYDIMSFYENHHLNQNYQMNQNHQYFYLTLEILLLFKKNHVNEILYLKSEKCLNYITTLLIYKKIKGEYPLKILEPNFDSRRIRAEEYTLFYLNF